MMNANWTKKPKRLVMNHRIFFNFPKSMAALRKFINEPEENVVRAMISVKRIKHGNAFSVTYYEWEESDLELLAEDFDFPKI